MYFVDGSIEWDYYYARSALTDGDQFGIEETKVRNRIVPLREFDEKKKIIKLRTLSSCTVIQRSM